MKYQTIEGKRGLIRKGEYTGRFVKVVHDVDGMAGYFILISKNQDFSGECFDYWMKNEVDLERQFLYWDWDVEWQ